MAGSSHSSEFCLHFLQQLQRSSLESFLIIGRVSSEAVIEAKLLQNKSFLRYISAWLEDLSLEARLLVMRIALWIFQLRRTLAF